MADYEAFAADFDRHAATSAYNAHYDRPAVLDLLGRVEGLHVFDAGCGSGLYARELVTRGARVSGVDVSASLVELARRRLGPEADVRVHDLDAPLSWVADESVDRVVMALVLHHLRRPVATLRELHRVLTAEGKAVISTVHPTSDWLRLGGSYFTDEQVEETWNHGWQVRFRRAPLQRLVADFAAAGFVIEELVEPQPTHVMARTHPETWKKLHREPGFIAFSLGKTTSPTARAGRAWRPWTEVSEVVDGARDASRERDRSQTDDGLRDPWTTDS